MGRILSQKMWEGRDHPAPGSWSRRCHLGIRTRRIRVRINPRGHRGSPVNSELSLSGSGRGERGDSAAFSEQLPARGNLEKAQKAINEPW